MEQVRTWVRAGVSLLGGLANAVLGTVILAPLLYGAYLQLGWIPRIAGLSKAAIYEDFMRIWTYLWQVWRPSLELAHFASSAGGRQHFAEVRTLIIGLVLLALLLNVLIWRWARQGQFNSWSYWQALKQGQWGLALLGLGMLLFFDQAFVAFHRLLFDNELWLFDPRLDPVIWILPQSYFLGLTALILAFYGLWSWLFAKFFAPQAF